jgi:dipeptide/tripeptide permease
MFSNMDAPSVEFVKFAANERAHNAPLFEKPENRKTSARLVLAIHITTYWALSRQNFNMWWEFSGMRHCGSDPR